VRVRRRIQKKIPTIIAMRMIAPSTAPTIATARAPLSLSWWFPPSGSVVATDVFVIVAFVVGRASDNVNPGLDTSVCCNDAEVDMVADNVGSEVAFSIVDVGEDNTFWFEANSYQSFHFQINPETHRYSHLFNVRSLPGGHPTPGLHASTKQHPTNPLLQL
jgi:hypothetical protein